MEENTEKTLKKLEFNIEINNDEIEDLNNEDALHLNDGLTDNNNADIENMGLINKQDNKYNHFGAPNDNIQQQNHHFKRRVQQNLDANDKDDNNNIGRFNVVGDEELSTDGNNDESHDNHQSDSNSYSNSDNESASEPSCHDDNVNVNKSDNDSDAHSNDSDIVADSVNQRRLSRMVGCLRPKGSNSRFNGNAWTHTCPMLSAMIVVEQVCVCMMKKYFKIEASKSTPQ